jgi:hypothetical protein
MWNDFGPIEAPTNNYTLVAALAYHGYDSNYLITFWTTFISTILDLFVIGISWGPFNEFY